MKIVTAISATVLLALGGCATCQQHPVYCAAASAIVVGSAAAILEHHHDQGATARQIAPGGSPQCRNGVCP